MEKKFSDCDVQRRRTGESAASAGRRDTPEMNSGNDSMEFRMLRYSKRACHT
ncbi:MAG: hypothetical protein IKG46_07005 [Solobacterium sp.]|nr:hypothetical protein [Solobacterium sp.]